MLAPWKESYDKPRQCIKKQRHYFADKGPYSQSYGFSSSHVWMLRLDPKEGSVLKNWCFQIVVLEKILERPLDSKEIKPANRKGNQPRIITARINAEVEAPIPWSRDVKSRLIGKDPDAGKDWRQQEKGAAEDEMDVIDSTDMNLSKLWEIVKDKGTWCATVYGVTKCWTWLSD